MMHLKIATSFGAAVLLFIALNFFLSELKDHGLAGLHKIETNAQQVSSRHISGGVLMLGSSYMFFPLAELLATRENLNDIELVLKAVTASTGKTILNLTYPSQMVSDDCIWLDTYLKKTGKPAWVVLGLAPRDFYDPDFRSPLWTETFIHVAESEYLPKYIQLSDASFDDKIQCILHRTCIMFDKRKGFLKTVAEKGNRLLDRLLPESKQPAQPTQLNPFAASSLEERWKSSMEEYRYRYKDIQFNELEKQNRYLVRILQTCDHNGIPIVVVNMPLSPENKALLPQHFYDRFKKMLAAECRTKGCIYLNLGESDEFSRSDYSDSVHLNKPGGIKLFDKVFSTINAREADGANGVPVVRSPD